MNSLLYKIWIRIGLRMRYFELKSVNDARFYKNLIEVVIPGNERHFRRLRMLKRGK